MRLGTLALATLAVGALSAPAFAQGHAFGGAHFHAGGTAFHGHFAAGRMGAGAVTATRVGAGAVTATRVGAARTTGFYGNRVGNVAYRGHDYDGGFHRRGDGDWDHRGYWGGGYYRGGDWDGGWGWGGLAAGAIIGGAVAATSYDDCAYPYNYGVGYGDGWAYGWNRGCDYGYGYAPTYAAPVTYYEAYPAPMVESRTVYAPRYGYSYVPRYRYSTSYYRHERTYRPVHRAYIHREYIRHRRIYASARRDYRVRTHTAHVYRGDRDRFHRSHLAMKASFRHDRMVTGRSAFVHHASFRGHAHHAIHTRVAMHGHATAAFHGHHKR